ncbi:C39 family peptidase [Streptomyces sp. NPDC056488]|uniref:C39 family peptidase n=1 Tax=Streptomyces sp. NPDC056488 TaxID=3345836 RepID=UPI0036BEA3F4
MKLRGIRSGTTIAICAALLVTAGGTSAQAVDGEQPQGGIEGNWTGSGVTAPDQQIELSEQAKEKIALTDAWVQAQEGEISQDAFAQKESQFLQKYNLTRTAAQKQATGASATAATAASSRVLAVTHYAQARSYYCGPATGAMMIKMIDGFISSRYNGNAFSQENLANSAHMDTNAQGWTDWSSKKFIFGLNRWRGENYYVQIPSPAPDNAVNAMRHSIGDNAKPIAADTVEFAEDRHYNNHPRDKTIGHWIAAYGYHTDGRYGKWVDPSTSVWPDVYKSFEYNTRDFTATFLQSNGYAY